MHTDFLVIGSGIAGLTYAVKMAQAAPDKQVTIITKAAPDETNTKYAQGGVAVVNDLENDSYEKHIEDTLIAGDGLCNPAIVEIVVKEGPERINELIEWGAQFDKDAEGDYRRGKEGGHSEFRILHHKDVTGKEMERALLEAIKQAPNITLLNHLFVIDIITQHHLGYLVTKSTPDITCYGVYVFNAQSGRIETIEAGITLLATGGNGQVYRTTTNPSIATGDGVAMVYRAKGRIENMEFIQFHPTALYEAGKRGQAFLITEAVRGDGGILRNGAGEAFMERYDHRKDLAPRDIVARAIDNEMKIGGTEHVYLDCRHMDLEKFKEHFPNIYEKCLSVGIDVALQMIPVAPAAHYSCGGIKTDEWGRSSIKHLYACGECASTGLHGANRLASNSLLEAMVFAHRCYIATAPPPPKGGVANTQPTLADESISLEEPEHSYVTADPMTYGLLKEFVRTHRSHPTQAENVLWQQLRGKQLQGSKFRRQHIIGNYIADFISLESKLVIEVDGLIHQLPQNQASDAERTVWLNKMGYQVIRFTNEEVQHQLKQVLQTIATAIKQKVNETESLKSESGALANPPLGGRGAVPDWNATGTSEPKEMILITQSLKELQQTMSDYVGIVRNNVRLQRALKRIDLLFDETEELYRTTTVSPQLLELRNMITVGYLITKGAAFRKESRGLHYNTDYPSRSELIQNIVL